MPGSEKACSFLLFAFSIHSSLSCDYNSYL